MLIQGGSLGTRDRSRKKHRVQYQRPQTWTAPTVKAGCNPNVRGHGTDVDLDTDHNYAHNTLTPVPSARVMESILSVCFHHFSKHSKVSCKSDNYGGKRRPLKMSACE